jgi:hypothetical protein
MDGSAFRLMRSTTTSNGSALGRPSLARGFASATPFPDDFRRKVFALTLERLADLAADHDHVIVEETFHRRAIREPFFAAAAELLGARRWSRSLYRVR